MVTVISRESPLARVQVDEFFSDYPNLERRTIFTKSIGDKELDRSLLDSSVPSDFFTRELDGAILDGSADLAVHSAKDLPWPLPSGLSVICLKDSFDSSDSLVTLDGTLLIDLEFGAKVGTSSHSRREQLLAIRPDLTIISIRGNIGQRIDYLYRDECKAIIVASCALTRLSITLPAEKLPITTHPLQGKLALVASQNRHDLASLFTCSDIRKSYGTVTLVGAGPGDPELLTVKAVKAIASADVIYYDALCGDRVLGDTTAECIFVGKRKGEHSLTQGEINELLYKSAIEGKRVVRLKAGDPLLFSRGGEEIQFLSERMIEVSVIPGISAFQAAAAAVNMPITMREQSRSFSAFSGQYETDQPIPASSEGTSAYFMAVTKLGQLKESLLSSGRVGSTPVVLVHNVSHVDQHVVTTTINDLHSVTIPTPAMILVGNPAALAIAKPRLLFTGIDSSRLKFREELVHFPLIRTSNRIVENIEISDFDGIVFTSRTAVEAFFTSYVPLKTQTLFAVGPHTAEAVTSKGFNVTVMPTIYDAENLAPLVEGSSCKKILYPCSQLSQNDLHRINTVFPVVLYDTKSPLPDSVPPLYLFAGVIFSSPSTVDAFFTLWKDIPESLLFYVYGKSSRSRLLSYSIDSARIYDVEI